MLRTDFERMDLDDNGELDKDELYRLFKVISKRFKVPECKPWQIEYILNLIDENGNGKLDFDEVIYNYRLIVRELITKSTDISKVFQETSNNVLLYRVQQLKLQTPNEIIYQQILDEDAEAQSPSPSLPEQKSKLTREQRRLKKPKALVIASVPV